MAAAAAPPLPAPGISMTSESGRRTCKYCQMDDDQEDLIWPCTCKQDAQPLFVHRKCLNQWRSVCQRQEHFFECRECGYEFRLEAVSTATDGDSFIRRQMPQQRQQMRRLIGKQLRNVVFCTIALHFLLCLVAIMLRGLDPEEKLVELWHLSQYEHAPPAGKGSFLDALRYHKLTYYLSACVLMGICLLIALVLGCLCYCELNECAGRVCCSGYCALSLVFGQSLPCCGFVLGLAAVGTMTVIFIGAIGIAIAMVTLLYTSCLGCWRYSEMRRLSHWYQVKDRAAGLSPMELPPHAEPPDEEIDQQLRRCAVFHYNTTHGLEDPMVRLAGGALLQAEQPV